MDTETETVSVPPKAKSLRAHLWKPGQSGNPKGREKGSRNRLNDYFVQDFCDAWKQFGVQALYRTAQEEPATFVKVAAAMLPKELKIEQTVSDLTDDQLVSRLRQLADHFRSRPGIAAADADRTGSSETPARTIEAVPIRTISETG